jgi:hypothetical protein
VLIIAKSLRSPGAKTGYPGFLEAKHVGLAAVPLAMRVVILRKSFSARYEVTETLTEAVASGEKLPALCHSQKMLSVDWVSSRFRTFSTQRRMFEALDLLRCEPLEHTRYIRRA